MQLCGSLSILWYCLFWGLEWKLTFSSPVATVELSKFPGILSPVLSQYHLLGVEIVARIHRQTIQKRSSWPRLPRWCNHLELDILECEVKWALGSITMNKASGGDGIPAEIFQLLKGDSIPCLWLCRSQQTGKFLKRWEYQTTWPSNWIICMQVKKQQLELDKVTGHG